jgi:hypothetical protein
MKTHLSLLLCLAFIATLASGQEKPGGDAGSKFNPKLPKPTGEPAMKFDKSKMVDKMVPSAPVDKSDKSNFKKGPAPVLEEVRPFRDPRPIAAAIDRAVDAALAKVRIPASPLADDSEFLRRVTLDIIGRVPTAEEAAEFLASNNPEKRAQWIDTLLAAPSYGDHFAIIWRELMLPRDNGVKVARDDFSPWLSEQFSRNVGWDRIVTPMLTVEGKIRELPQSGFIMANSEEGVPKATLLADATARLFWGVQLRCAECHDHPFANWKQGDFWGTAAFFSRLRKGYSDGKNPQGWTLTETPIGDEARFLAAKPAAAPGVAGAAIVIPATVAKNTGKVIQAKFLGGAPTGWQDEGPFRERFAQWATSTENPWFASNAVNRLWAHFFARGLVMPMDGFNDETKPSHPEVLALLRKELVDSGFDLKHLIRCLCLSDAYQRSSRVVAGNERDDHWFSHHAVVVMRPEMLYDSVSTVVNPPGRKGGGKTPELVRPQPIGGAPRDEFIRYFGSRPDDNHGSSVNQGIPQYLRLMNSPLLTVADTSGSRFAKMGGSSDALLDAVYLAAYARKPADDERRLMKEYLAQPTDGKDPAAGVLWALLNSSEFVTNH